MGAFTMKTIFLSLLILFFLSPLANADEPFLSCAFLFSFGEKGEASGQFLQPIAVSIDATSNIYVADAVNNRVQKFNDSGELSAFVGGFGWNPRQFQFPTDLYVYNSLDLFVADFENHRIERYDKDLFWIASYRSDENWDERYQFFFPRAVFVSIHGDIFLADAEYKRIVKFNSLFEPELSFGDFDGGAGTLQDPVSLLIDRKDRVYVSDAAAGKVLLYDYFGNYISEIGSSYLSKPAGISLDEFGNLFVADVAKSQILVFDELGTLIFTFGSPGDKFGAFNEPHDVCVHGNRLHVADSNNHRIQVFELQWLR
jgi:tripartite motif-containing protein 71